MAEPKRPKRADKLTPKRGILDPGEVAEKLRELDGNQAAVARHFGVARQSVNAVVNAHPEVRAVYDEARESMKDEAESSLHKAVRAGEAWAVCFYLKTQARDRGYVERPSDLPPLEILLAALPPDVAAVVRKSLSEAVYAGRDSGGGSAPVA